MEERGERSRRKRQRGRRKHTEWATICLLVHVHEHEYMENNFLSCRLPSGVVNMYTMYMYIYTCTGNYLKLLYTCTCAVHVLYMHVKSVMQSLATSSEPSYCTTVSRVPKILHVHWLALGTPIPLHSITGALHTISDRKVNDHASEPTEWIAPQCW